MRTVLFAAWMLGSMLALAATGCVPGFSPNLEIDGYDRSCQTDDDCIIVTMTDVCSDCANDAISVQEQEHHARDLQAAQAMCLWLNDCGLGIRAACAPGGVCVAEPIN